MSSKNNKNKKDYRDEVLDWEADRVVNSKKMARNAWVVAGLAITTTVSLSIGAMLMLPLKETIPYVITLDKSTGQVEIAKPLKDGKSTYDEVTNKYWIAQFLRHRERYLPSLYSDDYYLMGLTLDNIVFQDYIKEVDPFKNKSANRKVYKDNAEIVVNIKNISFLNEGSTALVRFSKTLKQLKRAEADKVSHWVATLDFRFTNASMKDSDRLLNPLGFKVSSYRLDLEVVK